MPKASNSSRSQAASNAFAAPPQHPRERVEALAAGRAEAYQLEVEELRVTVARAHLKIQQQADEHSAQVAALTAELEARGRGEMLARTRCEAAEHELRGMRKELNKLREALKRGSSERQEALSDSLVQRCQHALHGFARHGLISSVLSWRRRALLSGMARWQSTAQLLEAERAHAAASVVVSRAGSLARAEAAASNLAGPEAWFRDVQRGYRSRRLGNWSASSGRVDLTWALHSWRLASCAMAAEDDLRDVAGRLRSAQAGMVKVLDGRSAAEDTSRRHVALARALVGITSLLGVRREGRDRKLMLQSAFRPWLLLLLADKVRGAQALKNKVSMLGEEGATTHRRVDALTREIHVLRNNLAASAKKVREAGAEAEAAAEATAKAEGMRDKAERAAKLSQSKMEGLEREKYAAAAAARKEKQTCEAMRRGLVALAMRAALTRGDDLLLASAIARWAVFALQPERGAPWWQVDPSVRGGHAAMRASEEEEEERSFLLIEERRRQQHRFGPRLDSQRD